MGLNGYCKNVQNMYMAHSCKLTEIEYLENKQCLLCSNKLFYEHHKWCVCQDKNVKKLTCLKCEEIKKQINELYVELNVTLKIFDRECKYALTINAELYEQLPLIIEDINNLQQHYMTN
jgi:hypothetical protein